MFQVNMERLMALNQDPQRGVFIPISLAPQWVNKIFKKKSSNVNPSYWSLI
jgi:hypothetical protein